MKSLFLTVFLLLIYLKIVSYKINNNYFCSDLKIKSFNNRDSFNRFYNSLAKLVCRDLKPELLLVQAWHETGGNSYLMTECNNLFGLRCHWADNRYKIKIYSNYYRCYSSVYDCFVDYQNFMQSHYKLDSCMTIEQQIELINGYSENLEYKKNLKKLLK